jgi:hypothetical protein
VTHSNTEVNNINISLIGSRPGSTPVTAALLKSFAEKGKPCRKNTARFLE